MSGRVYQLHERQGRTYVLLLRQVKAMLSQAQRAYSTTTPSAADVITNAATPARYEDVNTGTSDGGGGGGSGTDRTGDDVRWSPHALAQFDNLGSYSDVSPHGGSTPAATATDRSRATPSVAASKCKSRHTS